MPADHGDENRHHGQLTQLDTEVEAEQRQCQPALRQAQILQGASKAETVHQAEDEGELPAALAHHGKEIVQGRQHHAGRDDRFDPA